MQDYPSSEQIPPEDPGSHAPEGERAEYERPRLLTFGSIAELTMATAVGGTMDGGGGQAMFTAP